MVLPQTVHWQRADEDYHACALERTNILTSKDNGIHELCKSAQVINLDSSFSNTLHCSEVHQPFLIQCWGYSRCPFIIHISISTRAQWDLSRKVNLKVEELAHMFFNAKLNFKEGFFWIFFDLSTPWGRKMHICKCMGILMGKWPKKIKWPKITFPGSKMVPKVSK